MASKRFSKKYEAPSGKSCSSRSQPPEADSVTPHIREEPVTRAVRRLDADIRPERATGGDDALAVLRVVTHRQWLRVHDDVLCRFVVDHASIDVLALAAKRETDQGWRQ